MTHPTYRFLRRPILKGGFKAKNEPVWFMKSVVGTEKVSQSYRDLGDILDNEDLKKVTGHGGRACLVTYSLLNGVTSSAVRQQTGHANVQSMLPYDRMSMEAEKVLQDALSGKIRDVNGNTINELRKERAVKKKLLVKGRFPPESPCKVHQRCSKKKKEGRIPATVHGITSAANNLIVIDEEEEDNDKKMRPIKQDADHDVVTAPVLNPSPRS